MALSKAVADRLERHRTVSASLHEHRDVLAEQAERLLAPHVPEGETLDTDTIARLLAALGDLTASRADALQGADEEHNRELGDDTAARTALEEASDAAVGTLRQFKDGVIAAHGRAFLDVMKLPNATPRTPAALSAQLSLLVAWLGDAGNAFPPPSSPFAPQMDRAAALAIAEPADRSLKNAIAAHRDDAKQTETTMLAKYAATDAYDDAERATVGVTTGLMRLAGMAEEARRLRP